MTSDQLRQLADADLTAAERASLPHVREIFLRAADAWINMARRAEAFDEGREER